MSKKEYWEIVYMECLRCHERYTLLQIERNKKCMKCNCFMFDTKIKYIEKVKPKIRKVKQK